MNYLKEMYVWSLSVWRRFQSVAQRNSPIPKQRRNLTNLNYTEMKLNACIDRLLLPPSPAPLIPLLNHQSD